MASFRIWHNPNKIDPHQVRVDFMFMDIEKGGSPKCSTFHDTEGIQWVSMIFISPITYLYKDKKIAISCDDVDFSSFDLVVSLDNSKSLSLQILHSNILSDISDGATGWLLGFSHREE